MPTPLGQAMGIVSPTEAKFGWAYIVAVGFDPCYAKLFNGLIPAVFSGVTTKLFGYTLRTKDAAGNVYCSPGPASQVLSAGYEYPAANGSFSWSHNGGPVGCPVNGYQVTKPENGTFIKNVPLTFVNMASAGTTIPVTDKIVFGPAGTVITGNFIAPHPYGFTTELAYVLYAASIPIVEIDLFGFNRQAVPLPSSSNTIGTFGVLRIAEQPTDWVAVSDLADQNRMYLSLATPLQFGTLGNLRGPIYGWVVYAKEFLLQATSLLAISSANVTETLVLSTNITPGSLTPPFSGFDVYAEIDNERMKVTSYSGNQVAVERVDNSSWMLSAIRAQHAAGATVRFFVYYVLRAGHFQPPIQANADTIIQVPIAIPLQFGTPLPVVPTPPTPPVPPGADCLSAIALTGSGNTYSTAVTGANTGRWLRFTVPTAGHWVLVFTQTAGPANYFLKVQVFRNGACASLNERNLLGQASSSAPPTSPVQVDGWLASGDIILAFVRWGDNSVPFGQPFLGEPYVNPVSFTAVFTKVA